MNITKSSKIFLGDTEIYRVEYEGTVIWKKQENKESPISKISVTVGHGESEITLKDTSVTNLEYSSDNSTWIPYTSTVTVQSVFKIPDFYYPWEVPMAQDYPTTMYFRASGLTKATANNILNFVNTSQNGTITVTIEDVS